ncbi:MAG: GNAT family N-acetyltransferase [Burkholderiales bacterium]|nr:MAG: GNAT family N-acetyltransferase [Burkholderiales bacterium]
MTPQPAHPGHFPEILSLNAESVRYLSPLDAMRLAALHAEAARHVVVTADGGVLAFLLAFGPAARYDSPNFLWFRDRYADFLYVDRVVVASRAQGTGLGRLLYDDLFAFARRTGCARITCEVDSDPPNPASEGFHRSYGFVEVGSQRLAERGKTVSMKAVELDPGAGAWGGCAR